MKKIIALSLLSSLVGCAQLMPPKTPLQTPIETINTSKSAETFAEPIVVAELDSSVTTDPLYQSSDSIAVSEQKIKEQPVTDTAVTVVDNDAPAVTSATEPSVESAVDTTAADNAVANNTTINDAPAVTSVIEPSPEPTVDTTAVDNAVANNTTINDAPAVTSATEPSVESAVDTTAADNTVVNNTTINDAPAVTSATEPSVESAVDTTAVDNTVANETTINDVVMEQPAAEASSDDGYKTVDMHGYSIQVTASRDEQSLATLLSLLKSQQPAWINKKMLNGSQVYTLLIGHYADYDQAKVALISLPQALQQNGAFVRNFYDIEHTRSPELKQLQ